MADTQGKLDSQPECPSCKKVLDGWSSTSPGGGGPSDGDVTVCIYCGSALEFADNLTRFKLIPDDQVDTHPAAADIHRISDVIHNVFHAEILRRRAQKN